ncbi:MULTISPECIES: DUF4179 domain-containing protein [Desulfitobacterium]|uniref:Uncharacterized protein n=1 Tax=Desulfitobacterium dehalogenans (strain ATCC 51507 / DSM 9161 / JW/IU-DC1) TaxID=756499 RepID=I4A5I1_DESDJ|nr:MULTISPECIES: DUF4179 domain-containing protein [Desulfitobacterium]AFL99215.1 hypothetical protein Desde_0768 [Desulfitobacterium dehalogenans ATCC 51507]
MEHHDFDQFIKNKAKGEPINVPRGFSERMDSLMANLPEKTQGVRRLPKKMFLVVAGFIVFASMSVVASPLVGEMSSGVISYFNAPRDFKYLSQQAVYEQYNSQVGVSASDQGIKVTVDNLAVDDNYISVFYTAESEEPIQLLGDEETIEQWRINWTAPHFWFKENGRYIEPPAQNEIDAYLEDPYTLKGMQRFAVVGLLEDTMNLEIYTEEIFGKEGRWHIPLSVDKSSVAVESLTVAPKMKAKVTTGWNGEYKHDITIEKVSISPFGNQIVLSERAENTFSQFALRDEQGRYLTVIPTATYGGNFFIKVTNNFEFIGGRTDMKELTLIPIVSGSEEDGLPAPKLRTAEIGSYPIAMPESELGGFVMEGLELTPEKAVATFHQEGAVGISYPDLILLDENGESLDFAAFHDDSYDRETGKITITLTFKDVSGEEIIAKAKKVGYYARPMKLNEDEAVTIKLAE